ncbi:hypothetical protein [Chthonobacter albigriseus]|uniref:hypothetical protein n=1 Tax=Chthonobacter albigriseus TaxID=1683161 RepID=UPI0015EF3726|nr:hypothetical protein [Chthonobacter albigriseus]
MVVLGLAIGLAACGRPTGDFGRAKPSALNDEVLPLVGKLAATIREEPVSWYNLTDDERLLRDRAWNFVRPPHVGDWWLEPLVEGQRTRILPVLDPRFNPTRYYLFLRAGDYRSSETRWTKVMDDITGDALLVPPFCEVAARVRRTDAWRIGRVNADQSVTPDVLVDTYNRIEENNRQMSWVWRALAYRLTSYRFAIERMALETPSEQMWAVNRAFDALAAQQCADGPAMSAIDFGNRQPRRSRLLDGPDPFDEPVLQK